MNTPEGVKVDERTVAVMNAANTWGLNFVSFAVRIDPQSLPNLPRLRRLW